MDYWAKPRMDRHQTVLFSPTLDECIDQEHPVRLLDEVLRAQDWSAWEQHYDGRRGQPPIPPWVMAGVILYGLMRRIRSSRQLEYACANNLDFLWLAEGRQIDHTTLCIFRTKFKEPLKQLFKQTGRLAMAMGLVRLVEVAFDGTRVRANANRFHTWTAEKVEEALLELETRIERMLGEADVYYCPMGQAMPYRQTKKFDRSQGKTAVRIYACKGCAGCPLAAECLDARAQHGRTVTRDGYEPSRERMHAKMQTEQGQETYNRRMHVGETPFAVIKCVLEVRRFLLRGLEKVRTEWQWVCTAANLKKLIAALAALRAEGKPMLASLRG